MAENHYLMKYKGRYRILPELDLKTNDIPRDGNGEIAQGYDDIYIACQNGNKIYDYGHMNGNSRVVWLGAYIPSIGRGRNIKRALDEKNIKYLNYTETDEEILFLFMAKDIDEVAGLLKAKTSGANISPFSPRNLPKSDVEIPTENIEAYKSISSQVLKDDLLLIHKITTQFLDAVLQKTYKKKDKLFNYKVDIKKRCMARQIKEYIYVMNMWDEYLAYLDKNIKEYYKDG